MINSFELEKFMHFPQYQSGVPENQTDTVGEWFVTEIWKYVDQKTFWLYAVSKWASVYRFWQSVQIQYNLS